MSMIDFHTHILPNMDDGSRSPDESLQMLKKSADDNITHIVLTPHFYAARENPETFFERRNRRISMLNAHLGDEFPKLILGAEIEYFEGVTEMSELSDMCIGMSNALLLEMPFSPWSNRIVNDILDINSRGYQVILAHIERYAKFQSDSVLKKLISQGIVMQSNANFFVNRFTKRKALKMLSEGLIHILGSDCHNITSRPPNMKEAVDVIEKKLGREAVNSIANFGERILDKELQHQREFIV